MRVIMDLNYDEIVKYCWGRALSTIDRIRINNKEEEFIQLLDEFYETQYAITIEDINYFLSDDINYIFESLGIETEEEEDKKE